MKGIGRRREPGPRYDYVVVGAGAAGCVLANRLTEDGTRTVLLLEAGPPDRSPYIHVPAGLKQLGATYDWRYQAQPDPSRNGVVDDWAAGKVLGGSTSINGMIWVRGNPGDFDDWAAAGADGWDWAGVEPYFRKSETFGGPADPTVRGTDGPQWVERSRVTHQLTEAFLTAGEQAGHAANPDYNGLSQRGVARGQHSQKRGWRRSAARSYLSPARRRRNLTLVTGAVVDRVLIEEGVAVGVEYRTGGTGGTGGTAGTAGTAGAVRTVRVNREVLLCAGALASPTLLMRSGVGPAEVLDRLGIPVLVDRAGVGANLQDHPATMLRFAVNVSTINQELTPIGIVKHGLDFALRGRGAVTSAFGTAELFGPADLPQGRVDYQAIFCPFALDSGGGDDGTIFSKIDAQASGNNEALGGTTSEGFTHDIHDMRLTKASSVDVTTYIVHPVGRGRVSLRSADPGDGPLIEFQMLGEDADLIALANACRDVRRVFDQLALKEFVVEEELPGSSVQTDDEWRQHLHGLSYRAQHPVGTCRMGSDDAAVVDPDLRVRGVRGLRVVDASVMPSLTSGNTMAPTIMIGERAADLIRSSN